MEKSAFLRSEQGEFFYLGYKLSLGRAEYALLSAIWESDGMSFDTYALAQSCGVAESNIAATVASINQKAMAIGGRKMILSGRGTGYRLEESL